MKSTLSTDNEGAGGLATEVDGAVLGVLPFPIPRRSSWMNAAAGSRPGATGEILE